MASSTRNLSKVSAKPLAPTFSLANRIAWLRVVVAGSFLLELLLSWRLWIGPRTFPKLPLFDIFPASWYVDVSIFVFLVVLLVVTMVHPRPRVFVFLFLGLVAVLAIDDQMRWQPYFYQHSFMLAALAFFAWPHNREQSERGQQIALVTCQWIVASLYFYAGLQKVNVNFVSDVFPWFVQPVTRLLPELQPFLILGGFFVPFLEISLGIGLLLKGFKSYAITLACAMHAFIFWMLGPLGHDWGFIVWPWNVSMMLLVAVLYWRVMLPPLSQVSLRGHLIQKTILALFVFMPLLSFFNLWDSYLSATMYSGNTNSAQIFISSSVQQQLPLEVQAYVGQRDGGLPLNYFYWSYYELGVITPPEARIFKGIAKHLCAYAAKASDVTLVIHGKQTLFRADEPATYTCATLGG